MLYNTKEFKLSLHGMQTDCIRFGSGEKKLVMIQGLNTRGIKGSGLSLAFMYRIFSKDYTVYLFDRRPNIEDGITVRDMAADIAEAMDTLDIKNADVLGVSQGGMIAQYLAIDRPELVNRLVLAFTISRNNSLVEDVISTWVKMAEEGNMKALTADMAERMYSERYLRRYRPLLPLLTLLQKPKDVRRFSLLAKSCLSCSAYDELEGITCPVLVIGAKEDKVVGGDASVEIAEKLGCKIHMYESLGHAAYEEAGDFNQIVFDFFRLS